MPQPFFQFKQFRIDQAFEGLKVTTDACLIGAWVDVSSATNILDIGTGTGLLALMMAQKNLTAKITAIEVNLEAAQQAKLNFDQSPWRDRIALQNIPIQEFATRSSEKFDLVIANPPFFSGKNKSSSPAKSVALHSDLLSPSDLAQAISQLLADSGHAFVLYPAYESQVFEQFAYAQGLYVHRCCDVYNKEEKPVFRRMLCLSKTKQEPISEKIIIREKEGCYSQWFVDLLQPFYLHL